MRTVQPVRRNRENAFDCAPGSARTATTKIHKMSDAEPKTTYSHTLGRYRTSRMNDSQPYARSVPDIA
eukprot:1570622-Rhodomonas_salina.1